MLIQEEADDMSKREVFGAVPSIAYINFQSTADRPRGVQQDLKTLLKQIPEELVFSHISDAHNKTVKEFEDEDAKSD